MVKAIKIFPRGKQGLRLSDQVNTINRWVNRTPYFWGWLIDM